MFDIVSFLIGLAKGKRHVIIEGDSTYTDANSDGNIVITSTEVDD